MEPEPALVASVQVDIEPGWRGGQRQVLFLCRGLADRGHPVTLVARRGDELARRGREAGLDVRELAVRRESGVAAARTLAGFVREVSPDVVGLHSGRSHGLGAVARLFLGRAGPRFVVTRRVVFRPGRDPLSRLKYRWAVDGYIAISRAVAGTLEESGVPAERIRVVYSGVDHPPVEGNARQAVRGELDLPLDVPVACMVGALTAEKGVGNLLEAVASAAEEVPNLHVVIVGDGPMAGSLRHAAELLKIGGRVRFTGYREDTARMITAADLLVIPSRSEGLGTVALDAQLLGIPVLATRAGGLPEVVVDGETGLLAPIGAPDVLGAQIVRMVVDDDLRDRVAAAAIERARRVFTADAMVEGTLTAYRELTALQR